MIVTSLLFILIVLCIATNTAALISTKSNGLSSELSDIIQFICLMGELEEGAWKLGKFLSVIERNQSNLSHEESHTVQAKILHTQSELALILRSDFDEALRLHRLGKEIAAQAATRVIPPLPELHLQGNKCGGVGDLYYVAAVIIKQLFDLQENQDVQREEEEAKEKEKEREWVEALITLITLTSDSGFPSAVPERHWSHAMRIVQSSRSEHLRMEYQSPLHFRSALLVPGVFASIQELHIVRSRIVSRIRRLHQAVTSGAVVLEKLDEFVLSPTFYLIYFGYNDREILTQLHASYQLAHPDLWKEKTLAQSARTVVSTPQHRFVRIGFVSSYFRRHSVCKLFCAVIVGLSALSNSSEFFLFSTLQENLHDDYTQQLITASRDGRHRLHFVSVGKPLVHSREEITRRNIDVLVYLDVGMDPATNIWATARLAPLQLVTWGHPSTSGLSAIDYYISSELYHRHHLSSTTSLTPFSDDPLSATDKSGRPMAFFSEQLIQFETLNFQFLTPSSVNYARIFASAAQSSASDGHGKHHHPAIMTTRGKWYYQKIQRQLKRDGEKREMRAKGRELLIELIRQKIRSLDTAHAKTFMSSEVSYVVCPQYLPKFHPNFDILLMQLITQFSGRLRLILLNNSEKKLLWQKTLIARWMILLRESLPLLSNEEIQQKLDSTVVWMHPLSPEEYLWLMAIGDLMIDPFPFGGGVTTLESLYVCTPVLTLPSEQNVPQLAAGMITALANRITQEEQRQLFLDYSIAQNQSDYLRKITVLLHLDEGAVGEDSSLVKHSMLPFLRETICKHHQIFYQLWEEIGNEENEVKGSYYHSTIAEWRALFDRLTGSL